MNKKFEPCPFCGKTESVEFDCDGGNVAVVCNVHMGGCGASSGWHQTYEGAILAWNGRIPDPKKISTNIGTDYDDTDQFVCSNCGIHLQNWVQVEVDEDDGEETHREYSLRYCPHCGARVRK